MKARSYFQKEIGRVNRFVEGLEMAGNLSNVVYIAGHRSSHGIRSNNEDGNRRDDEMTRRFLESVGCRGGGWKLVNGASRFLFKNLVAEMHAVTCMPSQNRLRFILMSTLAEGAEQSPSAYEEHAARFPAYLATKAFREAGMRVDSAEVGLMRADGTVVELKDVHRDDQHYEMIIADAVRRDLPTVSALRLVPRIVRESIAA